MANFALMQLSEWLSQSGMTVPQLQQKLGLHDTSVYRYLRGERVPRRALIHKIAEITDNAVTANDWFHNELTSSVNHTSTEGIRHAEISGNRNKKVRHDG